MTDGVADDYFPNDPGMLNLYEDLVKERIIASSANTDRVAGQEVKQPISAQERLRYWLDSYYVKGSFDDRDVSRPVRGRTTYEHCDRYLI